MVTLPPINMEPDRGGRAKMVLQDSLSGSMLIGGRVSLCACVGSCVCVGFGALHLICVLLLIMYIYSVFDCVGVCLPRCFCVCFVLMHVCVCGLARLLFPGSIAKGSSSKSGCKLLLPTSHANLSRVTSPANFSCQLFESYFTCQHLMPTL